MTVHLVIFYLSLINLSIGEKVDSLFGDYLWFQYGCNNVYVFNVVSLGLGIIDFYPQLHLI